MTAEQSARVGWTERLRTIAGRGGRPLRYIIAGLANTAFSIASYPLLLWSLPYFQAHYMLGLAIVQPAGIIFSFATQKFGVFRTNATLPRIFGEFVRYVSFYMIYFALNWAALPILVGAMRIPPVIAQTGFQTIAILMGYLWHSRVTFADKRPGAALVPSPEPASRG